VARAAQPGVTAQFNEATRTLPMCATPKKLPGIRGSLAMRHHTQRREAAGFFALRPTRGDFLRIGIDGSQYAWLNGLRLTQVRICNTARR
jgi:hypothetical protein